MRKDIQNVDARSYHYSNITICVINKDSLFFQVYSLGNDTVNHVMCGGEVKVDAPESGFTMRATIDTQLEEIHMMSG